MFQDLLDISSPEDLIGGRKQGVERRDVLKLGLAGLLGAIVPIFPAGKSFAASNATWSANVHSSHTNERFSGVYRVGDRYLPEAFERLNYVLRDYRTGEIFPMDPRAIDIVSLLQRKTRLNSVEVLSGYRCPKTNAMLRKASTGVAKNSLHMYGQALDIRAPGYNTRELRNLAKTLHAGGVGYYPRSNFVHVDTGEIRSW
jgi:uncharacterized protein YcbK (DUF882 family)